MHRSVKRWNAISEMYRIKYMRLSISSIIFGSAWESFRNELRWTMPMRATRTVAAANDIRHSTTCLMTMTTQFVDVTKYIYRVKSWLNWIKSVSQSVPTRINMFSLDFFSFVGINSSSRSNNNRMRETPAPSNPLALCTHLDVCLVLGIWILFKNGFIGCRLRPSFIPISLPSVSPFMRFDITFSTRHTHTSHMYAHNYRARASRTIFIY